MWIPYGLLGQFKAETDRNSVQASEQDREEREFLVGFFVRNPVTQTWEADLLVEHDGCQEGIAIGGRPAFVGYLPGKSGKLEEIIYRMRSTAAEEALAGCFDHATDLLGLWSVQIGRGIDIAGWQIADIRHRTRWRCVPFRSSALEMILPETKGLTPAHLALADLYREARNAVSPRWRLLCALAVLEAWQRRDGIFAATDAVLAARGERRLARRVGRDMLLRSGALGTHDQLLDQPLAALVDLLRSRRDAVLATMLGGGPTAGDRRYEDQIRLAALANLADLAARQVVAEEFELHRSFAVEPPASEARAPA
jgi:hypothetical protein